MKIKSAMRHIALALTILICPATSYSLEPATTFLVGTGIASLALSFVAWWRSGSTPKKTTYIDPAIEKLKSEIQDLKQALAKKTVPAHSTDLKQAAEGPTKQEVSAALDASNQAKQKLQDLKQEVQNFETTLRAQVATENRTNTTAIEQFKLDVQKKIDELGQELKKLSESGANAILKTEFDKKCEELIAKIDGTKKTKNTSKALLATLQVDVKNLTDRVGPLSAEHSNLKTDYVTKEKELDSALLQLRDLTKDFERQLKEHSKKVTDELSKAQTNITKQQEQFATKDSVLKLQEMTSRHVLDIAKISDQQVDAVTKIVSDRCKDYLTESQSRDIFATKEELKEVKDWATETFAPKSLLGIIGQVKTLQDAQKVHIGEITALTAWQKAFQAQYEKRGRSKSLSPRHSTEANASSSSVASSNTGLVYIRDGKPVNVLDSKSHSRTPSATSTQISLESTSALCQSSTDSITSDESASTLVSSVDLNRLNSHVRRELADTSSDIVSQSISSASSSSAS